MCAIPPRVPLALWCWRCGAGLVVLALWCWHCGAVAARAHFCAVAAALFVVLAASVVFVASVLFVLLVLLSQFKSNVQQPYAYSDCMSASGAT